MSLSLSISTGSAGTWSCGTAGRGRRGAARRQRQSRGWNPRQRLYPVSQPLGPSGGPSQNLPPSGPWYELLLVLFPVFAPLRGLEKKKTEGWCFMSYSWARGSNNASLMKYQLGKISKSPVGASLQMVRDWNRLLRVVIICFLFVTCPAVPELESYFFPVRGPAPRDFCHTLPASWGLSGKIWRNTIQQKNWKQPMAWLWGEDWISGIFSIRSHHFRLSSHSSEAEWVLSQSFSPPINLL